MARRRRGAKRSATSMARLDKASAKLSRKVDKILQQSSVPRPRTNIGFPINKIVRMKYVQANQLIDAVGGVMITQIFRANSIFDPDITGVGHQPLARDQWMQFYNEYVVLGAKISCKFTFVSGTVPIQVGVFLTNSNTIGTLQWPTITEQGKCKDNTLQSAASAANYVRVVKKYSAKKFHNVVNVNDNFDDLGAVFSTNPSSIANFAIFAQSQDMAATMSCRVTSEIDYLVALRSPNELISS